MYIYYYYYFFFSSYLIHLRILYQTAPVERTAPVLTYLEENKIKDQDIIILYKIE